MTRIQENERSGQAENLDKQQPYRILLVVHSPACNPCEHMTRVWNRTGFASPLTPVLGLTRE
jgi:hypothetical protein